VLYEAAAILAGVAYDRANPADSEAGAVVAPLNSSLRSSGPCACAVEQQFAQQRTLCMRR